VLAHTIVKDTLARYTYHFLFNYVDNTGTVVVKNVQVLSLYYDCATVHRFKKEVACTIRLINAQLV